MAVATLNVDLRRLPTWPRACYGYLSSSGWGCALGTEGPWLGPVTALYNPLAPRHVSEIADPHLSQKGNPKPTRLNTILKSAYQLSRPTVVTGTYVRSFSLINQPTPPQKQIELSQPSAPPLILPKQQLQTPRTPHRRAHSGLCAPLTPIPQTTSTQSNTAQHTRRAPSSLPSPSNPTKIGLPPMRRAATPPHCYTHLKQPIPGTSPPRDSKPRSSQQKSQGR
jgi:hypothetical protein